MHVFLRHTLLSSLILSILAVAATGQSHEPTAPSISDSASPVRIDSQSVVYFLRRQQFLSRLYDRLGLDSSGPWIGFSRQAGKAVLSFQINDTSHFALPPQRDWIQEEFDRQHTDIPIIFDLGALTRSAIQSLTSRGKGHKKPIQHQPIPGQLEMRVLAALWEKGPMTGPDLYTRVASSVPITAEMFWNLLHRMAEQGFLEERQVSPRLPFTLLTPVAAVEIEMSPTNRRNRVFEYRPVYDRAEVLQYLLAQKYLQQGPAATDGIFGDRIDALLTILLSSSAADR